MTRRNILVTSLYVINTWNYVFPATHLGGWKKCNTFLFRQLPGKNDCFRGKYRIGRKFCRGSTQLREIRRFTTFSGVEARIFFRLRRFFEKYFFGSQEVSLYIRPCQKFPLYVTPGIIFWVGCYIYITSRHIL